MKVLTLQKEIKLKTIILKYCVFWFLCPNTLRPIFLNYLIYGLNINGNLKKATNNYIYI